MVERGVIRNRGFASQIRDFSGLRFGSITPTDIDGHIEYQNKCHVFYELKYQDAPLTWGQWLALRRLCDDVTKPALLIVAAHDAMPPKDIDVAQARVRGFRCNRRNYKPNGDWTVRQLVETFFVWTDSGARDWQTFISVAGVLVGYSEFPTTTPAPQYSDPTVTQSDRQGRR